MNIILVASHSQNFKHLPESLAAPGVRIILICCNGSLLKRSKFVDESHCISRHGKCGNFIDDLLQEHELLARLDGWFIFDKDDDLYLLALSNLSEAIKIKILPIKKLDAMQALGSKAGFVEVAKSASIEIPPTVVVASPSDLAAGLSSLKIPIIIKGDRRGGGFMVRGINNPRDLDELTIPLEWYPVILQKIIDGEERSVEALYRDGHLVGWLYSHEFETPKKYGPTVARKYSLALAVDAIQTLKKFGEVAGLHGYVSCGFIYSPAEDKHYLFEADVRINAWHHFGKLMGLDSIDLMTKEIFNNAYPCVTGTEIPADGIRIRVRDREIENAIYDQSYRKLIALILRTPNDGISPRYQDKPLARIQNVRNVSVFVLVTGKSIFRKLPKKMQQNLKNNYLTKKVFEIFSQG